MGAKNGEPRVAGSSVSRAAYRAGIAERETKSRDVAAARG